MSDSEDNISEYIPESSREDSSEEESVDEELEEELTTGLEDLFDKGVLRSGRRYIKKLLGDTRKNQNLRTAFGLLDRNQDGHVTANELQFMLRNLGIHVRDELIDDLIKEASHTGNGLIDETEFLQWVARIQALRDDSSQSSTSQDDDLTQDLIAAFRVFDRDGNGYITRDELQTAMDMIGETVTEAQLSEMLAIADLDKDGKINYEEFARLLL